MNAGAIQHGTPVVFKRDCANTLNVNFTDLGEIQIARNPSWCFDIVNGSQQAGTLIHMVKCQRNTAQLFAIRPFTNDGNVKRGSCYRRPNTWGNNFKGCLFNNLKGGSSLIYENGNPATVWVKYTKSYTGSSGYTREESTVEQLGYLNESSNILKMPSGIVDYTIFPWNEGGTTNFLLKY